MIPYTRHTITPEDEAAVLRALRSGYLTRGPETEAFEAELAAVAQCRHAVVVNSGTFALMAVGGFVTKPVLTVPAISFMATASAFGKRVRFVDIASTGLAVADITVTLGGRPRAGTIVDACHGPIKHLGSVATVLSFHPAKHVACGEGGAVLTNLDTLASFVRLFRHHGRNPEGRMVTFGTNGHLSEMQAALGRSQLARYAEGVARRQAIAARYDAAFAGKVETIAHGPESARHLYQVRVPNGQAFTDRLATHQIRTQTHYHPIPLEPYYRERFGYAPGDFPEAERWAREVVTLPLFPSMTDTEITTIIEAVHDAT